MNNDRGRGEGKNGKKNKGMKKKENGEYWVTAGRRGETQEILQTCRGFVGETDPVFLATLREHHSVKHP